MRTAEEIMELLEKQDFDIEQALQICIGDKDIYMEVLQTALEEGRRKLPIIRESVEKGDYDRYLIEVHGLKNAAKSVGAIELSGMAYDQEMAVRRGDTECALRGYEALLEKYNSVLDLIEETMQ